MRHFFANKEESKRIIVNKTLLQNYSPDMKNCSTWEEKSEYIITEQKDEGNEVTYDVHNFNISNVFVSRRKNSDVSYEKVYMANTGNEYLTDILEPNMSLMTATFI